MELSEQFQYGPAFKNKENSQGTLFRPARKGAGRTPESRQPKGYSPERLRAVGEATGMGGWYDTAEHGTTNPDPNYHWKGMEWDGVKLKNGKYNMAPAKQAAETLARSTAPIEHMQGVRMYAASDRIHEGELGFYSHEPPGAGSEPEIHIKAGEERGETPLHELGHHVDAAAHGSVNQKAEKIPSHTEGWDRREEESKIMGQTEGFADKYVDVHGRKPGYKRKPDRAKEYGENNTGDNWHYVYNLSGRTAMRFNDSYNQERYGSDDNLQKLQFNLPIDPKAPKHVQEHEKDRKARHKDSEQLFRGGQQHMFVAGHSPTLGGMTYFGPTGVGGVHPSLASNWIGKEPPPKRTSLNAHLFDEEGRYHG